MTDQQIPPTRDQLRQQYREVDAAIDALFAPAEAIEQEAPTQQFDALVEKRRMITGQIADTFTPNEPVRAQRWRRNAPVKQGTFVGRSARSWALCYRSPGGKISHVEADSLFGMDERMPTTK